MFWGWTKSVKIVKNLIFWINRFSQCDFAQNQKSDFVNFPVNPRGRIRNPPGMLRGLEGLRGGLSSEFLWFILVRPLDTVRLCFESQCRKEHFRYVKHPRYCSRKISSGVWKLVTFLDFEWKSSSDKPIPWKIEKGCVFGKSFPNFQTPVEFFLEQ